MVLVEDVLDRPDKPCRLGVSCVELQFIHLFEQRIEETDVGFNVRAEGVAVEGRRFDVEGNGILVFDASFPVLLLLFPYGLDHRLECVRVVLELKDALHRPLAVEECVHAVDELEREHQRPANVPKRHLECAKGAFEAKHQLVQEHLVQAFLSLVRAVLVLQVGLWMVDGPLELALAAEIFFDDAIVECILGVIKFKELFFGILHF